MTKKTLTEEVLAENGPQKGSWSGKTKRSVGENAKRSTRGSRSRTAATPFEGRFQYRLDRKVEAVLKSSLLTRTLPAVSTYTRTSTGTASTIASYLRACTKEYCTSGMYQGQLQEYNRSFYLRGVVTLAGSTRSIYLRGTTYTFRVTFAVASTIDDAAPPTRHEAVAKDPR
jgi:hypothetical protein